MLTKPSTIYKGSPATFTLDKAALAAHSGITDSYYADTANWKKVLLSYKSSVGNQKETVRFDQGSSEGVFEVSLRARNSFQLQNVFIYDFDNAFLAVPRSAFTSTELSQFDVSVL